ncbi:Cyclin [Phytophthora megakarya]|uniref:Cyclin n=1 Tax=Phytophthora megakarya TaxID=4795 RepID=A0A225W368_9STRA|nr:Cyclin [Phytophthora megakarya]
MVFTGISALVQSQWHLLRSAFDAEGHERRVQHRQEKKQAKQQRKAARRAAREARRAQRKQRHTLLSPTVVGDRTDDEERPETSSNSKTPATNDQTDGGLAWARTAEALTDVAGANESANFFKSEPSGERQDASSESVAVGAGYEKVAAVEATPSVIAKAVVTAPQLPMELALEIEAQLEQKQREFYDSLGGYSTVDEEDDELHENLAGGRRVSDAKLPSKWTVVGIKKAGALPQTAEKEVFFTLPETTEMIEDSSVSSDASPATSTSSSKKPRQKSLSRSSEFVETEPEDDGVDLRDSEAFDGYSTFDEEDESRDLFIADHEFDGLCAPPSSASLASFDYASEETIEALETKVDPTDLKVIEEDIVDKLMEMDVNDGNIPEVSTRMEQLETKQPPTEETLESPNVKDMLHEEESTETESEEELENVPIMEEVVEVEMNEVSEMVEVAEEEVAHEIEEQSPGEDMFGQQTSLPASPSQSLVPTCSETPGVYSPGSADEYACSIYDNLRAREHRYHVTDDIFAKQEAVRPKMRAMLVDWLVEVHQRFELESQTLFLTVNYIDRYLAQAPVKSQRFQLVGVAALLIASKFEEIYPCDMDDLLYICERSYTKTDLVDCERDLLNVFKFNLAVPSVSSFLGYYLDHFEDEDVLIGQLANYFAECSLLDFTFGATYEPSTIACACLLAAYCYIENQTPGLVWNSRLVELTGYSVEEVALCTKDLWSILIQPSELAAVATKYSAKEFGEVAQLPMDDLETLLC